MSIFRKQAVAFRCLVHPHWQVGTLKLDADVLLSLRMISNT